MNRSILLLLALATVASPGAAQTTPPPASPPTPTAALPSTVTEGPFFVYSGSFRGKQAAQEQARALGGWVLRTDLYADLAPGFFAVVHGPFETRPMAEEALARILPRAPESQVRPAGRSRLPEGLGDAALLAALLGEVTVTVHEDVDDEYSCAPQERHLTVLLGYANTRLPNSAANAPAGGFWIVQRTGEVIPIRPCN